MWLLEKLGISGIKEAANTIGTGLGSVMDRFGFTKKLSEAERIDKYAQLLNLSEASTDSARQLFMAELATQKQPWLIRTLNGFVRPFGGIGALTTEFYAVWGENLAIWAGFDYRPIHISTEQHLVLGAIVAFYFGSRLKETLNGVTTKR